MIFKSGEWRLVGSGAVPPGISESVVVSSGLSPAPLRRATAYLVLATQFRQTRLWELARLEHTSLPERPAADAAPSSMELFGLAFSLLVLAFRSSISDLLKEKQRDGTYCR